MDNKKIEKTASIKRGVRIFLPFSLLLFSFVVYSITKQQSHEDLKGTPDNDLLTPGIFKAGGTTTPNELSLESTINEAPKLKNPTPVPINTELVPTTEPTRFPSGDIQLYGPPLESIFPLQTPITIYWGWPYKIEDNHHFSVYLINDSREYLVGSTAEPSMGNHGYQLNFIPANTINLPGTYQFEIRLEQKETRFVFTSSNPRALILTQAS